MLLPVSFFARSSDGSSTSQVAKLLQQKYLTWIPAAFNSFSKVTFLISASLLVFKSVIINEIIFSCIASNQLWDKQSCIAFNVWGIFSPIPCVVLLLFGCADQETGISGTFGAGGIELTRNDEFDNDAGNDGKRGHFSSGFFEGVLRSSNKSIGELFWEGEGESEWSESE